MNVTEKLSGSTDMAFDLKQDWSATDVSCLLGSVQDDRAWRLEVTEDGIVQLNDVSITPEASYDETLHCFFEIWDAGTDFVGHGAASDNSLCKKLERILRDNYPLLKGPKTLSTL